MPYNRFKNTPPMKLGPFALRWLQRFIANYKMEILCGGLLALLALLAVVFVYQARPLKELMVAEKSSIFPLLEPPVSPNASDVWLRRKGTHQFLRFERNPNESEFKSYSANIEASGIISIAPDYVVGISIPKDASYPDFEHVLVPGKLSEEGAIEFDVDSGMSLSSANTFHFYSFFSDGLFCSSFGDGLFCCFLDHNWDGENLYEIVSVQLSLADDKPKFQVKSKLEFNDAVRRKFMFQATRKNTLVLFGTLFAAPNVGVIHLVNVTRDGALIDEPIADFQSSLKTNQSVFWHDVSEDGKWLATTEVAPYLNQDGELAMSVMLSEIDHGRIVKQHDKRFSIMPRSKQEEPYDVKVPIRFESNTSLLVATPIGWGRVDFGSQSAATAIDKLRLHAYPARLVSVDSTGLYDFSGIVESKGEWFAVRKHEYTSDRRVAIWGEDAFVRIPVQK